MKARLLAIAALLAIASVTARSAHGPNIPHLEKQRDVMQLIVDGKPFLMLAGRQRAGVAEPES